VLGSVAGVSDPLFPGPPRPLPPRSGSTWTVTSEDPPKPPPVRHATGYGAFVDLAEAFGTDPRALLDPWTFAHFVRAHAEALEADPELLQAAVVFLGNALIAAHPECSWAHRTNGLAIESDQDERVEADVVGRRRSLGVGGTVPALLHADEARFREFGRVVDHWRPGAPPAEPRAPIPFRSVDPDPGAPRS